MIRFKFLFAMVIIGSLIGSLILGGGAAKAMDKEDQSGFLQDYSELQKTKDTAGNPLYRYVSPRLDAGIYKKIIVEPIQYFPEPQPTEDVNAKTLDDIKSYIDQQLKAEIGKRMQIVDEPGEGVMRFRTAITAVGKEAKDLKPYQFVPVALVLTGAKAAAGQHPYEAKLFVEAEITDSVSGERLGLAVRSGTGERVAKIQEGYDINLDALKPLLDQWIKAFVDYIANKN